MRGGAADDADGLVGKRQEEANDGKKVSKLAKHVVKNFAKVYVMPLFSPLILNPSAMPNLVI